LRVIELFKQFGIKGWRRKYKIDGKPDFVFAKQKIAIFVDGCFWHGCVKHCRIPLDNHEYWVAKIDKNIKRDISVVESLQEKNWDVIRIWEHEIKPKSLNTSIFNHIKHLTE
jgi:DNA mismatch endonuclease (patch repair protein)